MSSIQIWWMAARPKTLPASVSPILLGSALAWRQGSFHWAIFLLALFCAVALQVAVNLANDWFDAKSGVDSEHRLGPIRATQTGLIRPRQMAMGLTLVSTVAVLSGLGLVLLSSQWLLLFGLFSLLAVFAYSAGPYPLASHALGEATVLVFFGWLAVGGTYYAHSAELNLSALSYGTVAGLLSAAIMLVNNLRDIATDAPAGKKTLAVVLGDMASRKLYVVLLGCAVLIHLVTSLPFSLWLTLLPLLLLSPFIIRLSANAMTLQGAQLNRLLSSTAKLLLLYCLLSSVLLIG